MSLSDHVLPAEKYRLLLALTKAVNAQHGLLGVLDAICESVQPYVPLDAVGVVRIEGERFLPQEIHVRGIERDPSESWISAIARRLNRDVAAAHAELPVQFPFEVMGAAEVVRTRKTQRVDLTRERHFPDDELFYRWSARSYVRTPLVVRDRLIGVLEFFRAEVPRLRSEMLPPFTEIEADFLAEFADPLASTFANAFAYEDLAQLKREIELENVALRDDLDRDLTSAEIVGTSPLLRRLLAQIEKVALTDATVLVTGETGTGKELVARAIHRRSLRASRSMVKVNCAALPQSLIASELFGHERGAFTGALQRRLGRFELAAKGTLFLDEIGELAPDVQVSLLRVLQEKEFERVGGTQTIRSDARVIAATNRDLQREVAAGRFRSDLFYRLNVFPITVPPLRDRKDDIPILIEYFVAGHGARLGKKIRRIERTSIEMLQSYAWPGNIRELENVVERAVILADGERLTVDRSLLAGAREPGPVAGGGLPAEIAARERESIEAALEAARGQISGASGAAARLGVRPTTLHSKIAKYGIDKSRFRVSDR